MYMYFDRRGRRDQFKLEVYIISYRQENTSLDISYYKI